jgi:predicted metal-dependent phosphoesterase TrpH
VTGPSGPGRASGGRRAHVDLHCHSRASFDSLTDPAALVRTAASRGLTHLAVTDHDRISGALEARDAAAALRAGGEDDVPEVLVGEEIRTRDGDLVAVFLTEAIPPGLSAAETIAAVRGQGGVVGIPHPFDRFRGSMAKAVDAFEVLAPQVDWIEAWNARLILGDGNQRAAELAARLGVPGIAVSDAHTLLEIGVAATILEGDPSTAEGLRSALAGLVRLQTGHASAYVRLVTPVAKLVQRLRGNGRVAVPGPAA